MTIPLDSGGRECSQIFRQTIPIEEARTVLLPTKFVRYTGNGQVEDVKAQAVNPAELPKFQRFAVSSENLVGSEHMPAGEAV